jgi:hypothetical protein
MSQTSRNENPKLLIVRFSKLLATNQGMANNNQPLEEETGNKFVRKKKKHTHTQTEQNSAQMILIP